MNNKDMGLYGRYTLTHKDGNPIDPDKKYLVLELTDPDVREFIALSQFANLCTITGYTKLANDIGNFLYNDIDNLVMVQTDGPDMGPFPRKIANEFVTEFTAAGLFAKVIE